MSYGLFSIRRWKPVKAASVSLPTSAKFEDGQSLAYKAELVRAQRATEQFWERVQAQKQTKQGPVDFSGLPIG